MEYNPKLSVVYSDDVAKAFRCCQTTALSLMKQTGCAFKVGKRWAINMGVFIKMLQGQQQENMEVR